jgi:glutamate--cysteine ligase
LAALACRRSPGLAGDGSGPSRRFAGRRSQERDRRACPRPRAAASRSPSRRQLVEYLAAGCKPPAAWRIGTEHEKFAFRLSDLRPLPYDGPDGIGACWKGCTRFGWEPLQENGKPSRWRAAPPITLEPGGQFELSGAPLETIHQTCDEVRSTSREVKAIGAELGTRHARPRLPAEMAAADIPWMPKGRYAIMRAYMPKRGALGLDMMLRTCTVQVNLDFASKPTW